MTIQRDPNRTGLGGNYTTWYLWQEFLAAGYTIDASGSGTGGVYSATGSVFNAAINPVIGANVTQIGIGVGQEHWGNVLCWALFTAPDGSQYLMQRGNTAGNAGDDEWAYSYSPDGVFSLAGAAAATVPTAADERDLWGSPGASWPSIHGVGNVANLTHIAVDDALSVEGFSGFLCVELVNPNTIKSVLMVDDLAQVPSAGLFAAHAKTSTSAPAPVCCWRTSSATRRARHGRSWTRAAARKPGSRCRTTSSPTPSAPSSTQAALWPRRAARCRYRYSSASRPAASAASLAGSTGPR